MTAIIQNISRQHGVDPWLNPFWGAMQAAGDEALELGCGPGEDAAELTARGFTVVAFDLLRKPIRRAVEHAPDAHFFVADLRAPLPVRSGAVNVVVASLSIHYFLWQETLGVRDEVRRVLRPGGLFVFRVNATDDVNFGALQGEKIEPYYYRVPPDNRNNRPYKRFFDEPSLRALLTPNWRVAHLAHRTIRRYDTPKQVWECLAYPE